jgi:hypothetical protein
MESQKLIQELINKTPREVMDQAKNMTEEDVYYLTKTYKYIAKIEKLKEELKTKGIDYNHILTSQ